MPFLDSLDIANRGLFHLGAVRIVSVTEDTKNNATMSFLYDKLRRAELRRNVWRFATRRAVLRPVSPTTLEVKASLWLSTQLYLPGAIVSDANGLYWISTLAENLNNTPGQSPFWDQYFGPLTAELYSSGTTYYAGELIYFPQTGAAALGAPNYAVYQCLSNFNTAPATTNAPNVVAPWSATVQYTADQVVSYLGGNWRSLLPVNLNNIPANPPSLWLAASVYGAGNQITATDGFVYQSIGNGNVGNNPYGNAFPSLWTNTGVVAAWTNVPTVVGADPGFLPIYCQLANLTFVYPVGAGPSTDGQTRNVFRLPNGFLREAPQDPKRGSTSFLGAPSGLPYTDWEFEGNFMVSRDSSPIIFRFVADIYIVTKMDDMFCEGLGARLGYEACEDLTQSVGKQGACSQAYNRFMTEARIVNAIETGATEPPEDDYIQCRA